MLNAFDTRFFNGPVFADSGSPYYSRSDTFGDRITLSDPNHLYPPRRVEVGIAWEGGAP